MANLVFDLLHIKEHSKNYTNTDYFKQLVNDYYPQRLEELEILYQNMMQMEEEGHSTQLYLQKLIDEINMLWRAEKHYWQAIGYDNKCLKGLKFPTNYIVQKQDTITQLIAHLHALLFAKRTNENRSAALAVLADYIEIEYKLSGLLIEKERRIYEINANETI